MTTIKGPLVLGKGSSLSKLISDKLKNRELKVNLPFVAKNWKSKANSDLAGGKQLKKQAAKPRKKKRGVKK